MPAHSTITRADYENYLVNLYFGSDQDLLNACINRAYRDFNRTLHGFSEFENASELHNQAINLLKDSFDKLKSMSTNQITAEIFDDWHRKTCQQLISLFENRGFHFYVGQSQKWVNMTLKYIFTLGEQRIRGFEPFYPYCHVPFDNILLEQLEKYNFPMLNCAWSRIDNYDEYLQKQNWVRQRFSLIPMDVEFFLWLGKAIEPKDIKPIL